LGHPRVTHIRACPPRAGQAVALPRKRPRLAEATSQSPSPAQATDLPRQPRALAEELGRSHHCKEQVVATSPPARKSHQPEIPSRRCPAPGATELWTRATAMAFSRGHVGARRWSSPLPRPDSLDHRSPSRAPANGPPCLSSPPESAASPHVEVAVGAPPCPPPSAGITTTASAGGGSGQGWLGFGGSGLEGLGGSGVAPHGATRKR
jgi:hypothetical protein